MGKDTIKYQGVYKITNKRNGKVYIGQSSDVIKRWNGHIYSTKNKKLQSYDYPLYKEIRKYGIDNFEVRLIEEIENKEDMILAEQKYIDKYNSIMPNGYNMCDANATNNSSSKVTLQYDLKTGEVIAEFRSGNEAARYLGLCHIGVGDVCRGKRKSVGGFGFNRKDNPLNKYLVAKSTQFIRQA